MPSTLARVEGHTTLNPTLAVVPAGCASTSSGTWRQVTTSRGSSGQLLAHPRLSDSRGFRQTCRERPATRVSRNRAGLYIARHTRERRPSQRLDLLGLRDLAGSNSSGRCCARC